MTNITGKFRNADLPGKPQEVAITFSTEILVDEEGDLSFLEQDYADVEDADERAKYQAEDKKRLAAFNRGDWYMTGISVVAEVLVPIGGNSFTTFTLASAGLWGVESDAEESYIAEIAAQEKAELIGSMKTMGAAFANLAG